jgi:hypothetical protein
VDLDPRTHRCPCGGTLVASNAAVGTALIECTVCFGCCLVATVVLKERLGHAEPGPDLDARMPVTPQPRFRIVTAHGEHRSLFYVVDAAAPEDEQPCVVATATCRTDAEAALSALAERSTA